MFGPSNNIRIHSMTASHLHAQFDSTQKRSRETPFGLGKKHHRSLTPPPPPPPPAPRWPAGPSPLASKYRLLSAWLMPLTRPATPPDGAPGMVMVVLPMPLSKASSSALCVTLASSRSEKDDPMLGDVSEPGPGRRRGEEADPKRARCGGDNGWLVDARRGPPLRA